ncbi:4421_t:CDS:2, partial [Cetraspora pellucida]
MLIEENDILMNKTKDPVTSVVLVKDPERHHENGIEVKKTEQEHNKQVKDKDELEDLID